MKFSHRSWGTDNSRTRSCASHCRPSRICPRIHHHGHTSAVSRPSAAGSPAPKNHESAERTLSASTVRRSSHSREGTSSRGDARSAAANTHAPWSRAMTSNSSDFSDQELGQERIPDRLEHPVALLEKRMRLFSTSDCRVSRSAPATSSAASSVQPPRKTERRAKSCCSSLARGGRRTTRSWRAGSAVGVGVPPALSRSRRSERRSRIWAGVSAFVRAAASSTASGSESRRLHSSAIPSGARAGSATEELDRLGLGQRRDRVLDLARDAQELARGDEERQVGQASRSAASSGAASITCSRLSRRSSISRSSMCAARPSLAPSVCAIVSERARDPGARRARPRRRPPCTRARASEAASIASRVLPVPPGPGQSDESRPASTRESTSASSALAADEGARRMGRFVFEIVLSGGKRPSRAGRSKRLVDVLEAVLAEVAQALVPASAAVAAETSTCPPCPEAAMRAARCTSIPTYPREDPAGSPDVEPDLASEIGPSRVPPLLRRRPGPRLCAGRRRRRRRLPRSRPPSRRVLACPADNVPVPRERLLVPLAPSSSRSRVEPSMSVKRKVTLPLGCSTMPARTIARDRNTWQANAAPGGPLQCQRANTWPVRSGNDAGV